MTVTINKRAVWAAYVSGPDSLKQLAAADPLPSQNPSWNPIGGVFIHYRGPEPLFPSGYSGEDDCRVDIASVFIEHATGDEFEGDIAYNFLICPHGNIYEGRGYERGEANYGGYVDGIGRNAGFYSICGLLAGNESATVEMVQSFRALIQHLRTEAPLHTGTMILPHKFGYDTECPGNLTMYAQQGSSIDPDAPWSGLADVQLYTAQVSVNEIYSTAPGYLSCPEDGRPGWSTVLSMTQGLQFELGISPTVQNFGPGTFAAVRDHATMPSDEYNDNIIRLYNGALWAKGYWTSTQHSIWTSDSEEALASVYADAGLSYITPTRERMFPNISKALMRMDQFRLVPGGDVNIRALQQWLNDRYVCQIGIPAMTLVPCDGFYSRDVQQGFMMALQYELGIPVGSINGYFGPGTQAALAGVGSGTLTGNLRYLFRAACYFNSPTMLQTTPGQTPLGYAASDLTTDVETGSHVAWLHAFQGFSQIPVTGHNDYTTWAQLLVSSGDTTRPAAGCDCITEITAGRASVLQQAGYQVVGRYLDEQLDPSDPYYLGKALKPGEPETILASGLRFFPIFQYNGTQLSNFTYDKGYDQGTIAHAKSVEFRIPGGTCIYFAVDYDAMDSEIDSNIKPYFLGVRDALNAAGGRYEFGVYGSRNVCIRVSNEAGARWSLVSGMSWGYSGNLGFPLPPNWSFNQIREYEIQSGWGLDHDVWRQSGDPAVSALADS